MGLFEEYQGVFIGQSDEYNNAKLLQEANGVRPWGQYFGFLSCDVFSIRVSFGRETFSTASMEYFETFYVKTMAPILHLGCQEIDLLASARLEPKLT